MATYSELRQLFNDSDFINKVSVAVLISVGDILSGTPTAADKAYAAKVYANPQAEGKIVTMAVIAANSSATIVQIQGATDAAIQTQVNAVVLDLIDALAGV